MVIDDLLISFISGLWLATHAIACLMQNSLALERIRAPLLFGLTISLEVDCVAPQIISIVWSWHSHFRAQGANYRASGTDC